METLEEELERLLKNNPELLKTAELFLLEEEGLKTDPRVKVSPKKDFFYKEITVCGICETETVEYVQMRYIPRLSSYTRHNKFLKEEEGIGEKKVSIYVSSLTHCSACASKLSLLEKEALIEKLLKTKQERENREFFIKKEIEKREG